AGAVAAGVSASLHAAAAASATRDTPAIFQKWLVMVSSPFALPPAPPALPCGPYGFCSRRTSPERGAKLTIRRVVPRRKAFRPAAYRASLPASAAHEVALHCSHRRMTMRMLTPSLAAVAMALMVGSSSAQVPRVADVKLNANELWTTA